jgi:hypothetical protein
MARLCGAVLVPVLACAAAFGCSKGDVAVDKEKLGYYAGTYEECRARFLKEADDLKRAYKGVEITAIPMDAAGKGLTIDACMVPAQKVQTGLIIVSSGVHGIEGFAGSAVQRMIMHELLSKMDLSTTGVLFIHGVNPYGMKNERRVNEENVDLNRNFDVDKKLFALKNPGYPVIRDLLNPEEKLSTWSPGYVFFPVKAIYNIVKFGMGTLRESILKGQYEFPKGVYYGGKDFVPQKAPLEALITKSAAGCARVFVMDLHTGYGERGKMHYFPNPITIPKNLEAAKKVFEGYTVDWGDTGDFYITTGDITDYVEKLFPAKTVIRMTAEYGTMDSQTTMGSIRSLKITIMENQAANFGGKSQSDFDEAKANFREMYYPSAPEWRSTIMQQTAAEFPVLFKRFAELK